MLRAASPVLVLLAALVVWPAVPVRAEVSLTPTHDALLRQSLGAREAGLPYLIDDAQVHDAVRRGDLVTLLGNDDYAINPEVRHAAARPELKAFVERLGAQYRLKCGERLVVTSLVRPLDHQPWNSDPLSVHPTGIAVDMRVPGDWSCRRWLEATLLDLEARGVVEAAREHVVPHYHVVVFPGPYRQFLAASGITLPDAPVTTELDDLMAKLDGPEPFLAPASLLGASLAAGAATEAPVATVLPAVSRTSLGNAMPAVARGRRATTATRARQVARSRHTARTHATTTSRHASRKAQPATQRYKVRSGDTLWTIAQTHGVTVSSIQRANRIGHGIRAGQVLVVPLR
jgi:LysM repeat protein